MAESELLPAGRLRLLILDRDGVVNENRDGYVRGVEDWAWIPGSRAACRRLLALGARLGVVTNQAAIGHGVLDEPGLARIHEHFLRGLAGAAAEGAAAPLLVHCPHRPQDGCACRKPRPAMVHAVLEHFQVPAEDTLLIGDHVSDIAAAAAAGCWSAHVRSGRGEPPSDPPPRYLGTFGDLATVVDLIVEPALAAVPRAREAFR